MGDPWEARLLLVFLLSCTLPSLTWGLNCCDVVNYRQIPSSATNQTYFGIPAVMYRANSSNTNRCPFGTQCIPCQAPSTSVNMRDLMGLDECGACSETGSGGGVCAPCMLGDLCPAGTVNPFLWTNANMCPDGQRCTPDVEVKLNGLLPEISLSYNVTECPEGYICPAGTPEVSDILDCQKLWVDFLGPRLAAFADRPEYRRPRRGAQRNSSGTGPGSTSDSDSDEVVIPDDTPSGYYCAAGTSGFESIVKQRSRLFQECEEGHFCPTTRERYKCPDGKFCKQLYSEPDSCPGLDSCDRDGSVKPDFVWTRMAWMVALYVLLIIVGILLQARYERAAARQRKKQEQKLLKIDQLNFVQQALLKISNIKLQMGDSVFKPPQTGITVEFRHLSLVVGSGLTKKRVLNDVVGQFACGRMAGIMGPSGCGKSTLLNVLSGRATYGKMEGTTLINGKPGMIESLKNVTGFVPQDDTVFGDLTVFENISFSAKLRLPKVMTHTQKTDLVTQVIGALQLTPLTASIVGTVEKRGISGGQKKRVNIGMEMAADPTLLFLDEPTSGLAATDTSLVMGVLSDFTLADRTVVAVIHQPRYQVFSLFHDIVFMYPGGYVVYFGQFEYVEHYFRSLSFIVPQTENPADYYIDVISGHVPHLSDPAWSAADMPATWSKVVEAAVADMAKTAAANPETPASPNLKGALEQFLSKSGTIEVNAVSRQRWQSSIAKVFQANQKAGGKLDFSKIKDQVYQKQWDESTTDAGDSSDDPVLRNMTRLMLDAYKSVRFESMRQLSIRGETDAIFSPKYMGGNSMEVEQAPIKNLKRYFVSRGLDPQSVNDFLDKMDKKGDGVITKADFTSDITTAVAEYRKKHRKELEKEKQRLSSRTLLKADDFRKNDTPAFHTQLWHLLRLVVTQKVRVFGEVLANLTLLMVAGLLVGLLVGSDHQPFKPTDPNLSLMITLLMTVSITLSAVSAIKVFGGGETKVMADRQRRAGVNMMALYLSKVMVDLVENIWQPLFFLGISYNYVVPLMAFHDFYFTLVALSFASSGIGILISLILKPSGQTLAAVLWSLITSIFMNGAIGIRYTSIKAGGGQFLWAMMPPRWGQEMLLVNELQASSSQLYQQVLTEEVVLYYGYFPWWDTEEDYYGPRTREEQVQGFRDYLDDYKYRCYFVIFGIGLLLRLVGCILFTCPFTTQGTRRAWRHCKAWYMRTIKGAEPEERPAAEISVDKDQFLSELTEAPAGADLGSRTAPAGPEGPTTSSREIILEAPPATTSGARAAAAAAEAPAEAPAESLTLSTSLKDAVSVPPAEFGAH